MQLLRHRCYRLSIIFSNRWGTCRRAFSPVDVIRTPSGTETSLILVLPAGSGA